MTNVHNRQKILRRDGIVKRCSSRVKREGNLILFVSASPLDVAAHSMAERPRGKS